MEGAGFGCTLVVVFMGVLPQEAKQLGGSSGTEGHDLEG